MSSWIGNKGEVQGTDGSIGGDDAERTIPNEGGDIGDAGIDDRIGPLNAALNATIGDEVMGEVRIGDELILRPVPFSGVVGAEGDLPNLGSLVGSPGAVAER